MDTVIEMNPPSNAGPQVSGLLRLCWRALTEPARFFRHDLPQLDTSTVFTFGIANAWVAAALAFFMQTINSLILSQLLDRWMQRLLSTEEGFSVWGLSANSFLTTSGLLLLSPFFFLLQIYFSSGLLYTFARLLIEERSGAPEPVTFKGAARIQAVSLVSSWYSLVPIFGGVLSFITSLVLQITGVRERFGVSTRRASAVVLAPYFLLFFGVLLLTAFFLLALSQLPLGELMDIDPKQLGL